LLAFLIAAAIPNEGISQAPPAKAEVNAASAAKAAPPDEKGALPGDYKSEFEGRGESIGSTTVYFLRVLGSLAVLSLLIYLVVWFLRRLSRHSGILDGISRWRLGSGRRHMRLLETMSLGPTRGLHLLEVAGRILIVGSTAGSVTLIAEVTDRESVEAILADSGESSQFASAVRDGIKGYEAAHEPSGTPGDAAGRLRELARSVAARARGLGQKK
jgi:flagellar biosynthetic protein FliO